MMIPWMEKLFFIRSSENEGSMTTSKEIWNSEFAGFFEVPKKKKKDKNPKDKYKLVKII